MTDHRQDENARPATRNPAGKRRTRRLLCIAVLVLAVDALTKVIAVALLSDTGPVRLLGGAVYFTLARNSGAAFSMGSGMTVVFTAVIVAVILAILTIAWRVRSGVWAVALGLILGGAAGNLSDRLLRAPGMFRGAVIDFISIAHPWGQVIPIFNLADACIVSGGLLALVLTIGGWDLSGNRLGSERAPSGPTGHHGSENR